ncbi:DUF6924 domain-containing protein [Nocardia camponoti]|nr:hypothetical protein [Nocardia camponoti]
MAKSIPDGESILLRTDFSDDAAWAELLTAVQNSYLADSATGLTPVDDRAFDGVTLDDLPALVGDRTYLFLADATTMTEPEHPILAVDTTDDDFETFRLAPSAMGAVEVNLWLANMDFADFAESVDEDGIYRGFGE